MHVFRFHRRFGIAFLILLASSAGNIDVAHAQDKKVKPHTFNKLRNKRFGEILVVKKSGIDIYNTTGLNNCPAKVWNALDLEKIKKDFGAIKVQRNAPRCWMMDSQTVMFGDKAFFGGLEAHWGARLDPSLAKEKAIGSVPYKPVSPKKTQRMVYEKGKPVYELIDPEGHVYVMQGRLATISEASLSNLGKRLELPKGWTYRTRVLKEELVINLTADQTIYVVGDDFDQYYTRITDSK